MECLGPQCASMVLAWLKRYASELEPSTAPAPTPPTQGVLWASVTYDDDAPAIRSSAEWDAAREHLEYAIFRRFENQLTRAERARLDNTIRNTLFKMERYLERLDDGPERARAEAQCQTARQTLHQAREKAETQRAKARRADLMLARLDTLSPEQFEEFVAELFEALGYDVKRVGGTGDDGADLLATRDGLRTVVQCKYHARGVVGSPELRRFLGTVHHTQSHKGVFVTTSTFSLSAERFVAEHPIELVDGPRLVELVQNALGPVGRKADEPSWF